MCAESPQSRHKCEKKKPPPYQLNEPRQQWTDAIFGLAAGSSAKGKASEISEEVGYRDIPGFCYSATLDEIAEHGHVLTPGRYVGAEEVEDDGIPFTEKMATLTSELADQFAESAKLEKAIRKNMKSLGFELPVGGKK